MSTLLAIAGIAVAFLLVRAFLTRGERYPGGGELADAPPSEEAIRALLQGGRKIAAIKMYRALNEVDLKTAKEEVERLASRAPAA